MTDKMVEITVEVLGILATATKEMKQNQASEFAFSHTFLGAHIGSEKFVKRIAGRTDLEDGLKKLDKLTNDELVMAMAQLLKITHNIDKKVTGVADGIRDVDEKVQDVKDNVKAVDDITHIIAAGENSLFSWSPAPSLTFLLSRRQGSKGNRNQSGVDCSTYGGRCRRCEVFVSFLSSLAVEYLTRSQGINYEKLLEDGNLHLIHPQITTSRAIVNTRERRSGSLKKTNSRNGRKMVLFCGYMGNVRFFYLWCLR